MPTPQPVTTMCRTIAELVAADMAAAGLAVTDLATPTRARARTSETSPKYATIRRPHARAGATLRHLTHLCHLM